MFFVNKKTVWPWDRPWTYYSKCFVVILWSQMAWTVLKVIKPVFYRRYVDEILVPFELAEHLWNFCDYFNTCHPSKSFSFEQEKNEKWSFLDIKVSPKKKFVATVYRNHTFGGANNHFESFLPTVNKFDMIYTLNNRCFKIFSDWTTFHGGLSFLKDDFLKNGYPLSFNIENIVLKHFLISCS